MRPSSLRARVVALGCCAVAVLTAPPAAAQTPLTGFDNDPETTERIDKTDPKAAAIVISELRFPNRDAQYAVLARDDVFADSLAGAPLTTYGPLLLTSPDELDAETRDEIERVLGGAGTVYVLGGEEAIRPIVADVLIDEGHEVIRLSGASRVETSIEIAAEVRRLNPRQTQVMLARADAPADNPTAAWADAISGGAWAAATGTPIFLTPTAQLHPLLRQHIADAPRTILMGGRAALSDAVVAEVDNPVRIAGAERSETAAVAARELWPEGDNEPYLIVNAYREDGWAFGLAAAGLATETSAPILFASRDKAPQPTLGVLAECRLLHDVLLVGSAGVLADRVADELEAVEGGWCAPAFGDDEFSSDRRVDVGPNGIDPGTYRSTGSGTCSWQRIQIEDDGRERTVASESVVNPALVLIEEEDAAFTSSGCGRWSGSAQPLTTGPLDGFGEGAYLLGLDIGRGRWAPSSPGGDCVWERLSNLDGETGNVIERGTGDVTIGGDDIAFRSSGCGTFRWLGL